MANVNDFEYDLGEQTFESLCYVEGTVGNAIRRWADVDENGRLRPFKRESKDSPHCEIPFLHNKGAFALGNAEIVRWKAEPNRNDPEKTFFRIEKSQETPILVCPTPSARNVQEVKDRLKEGTRVAVKGRIRTLFVPRQDFQKLGSGFAFVEGLLCDSEECDCKEVDGATVWKLKPETTFLPVFKVSARQTLDFKTFDGSFRFLNSLDIGAPIKRVAVKTPREIALEVAKERWPSVVNAATELTRGEKQLIKKCFDAFPVESIVEEIARRCEASLEEAGKYWDETRQNVDGWLNASNDDIKAFVALLERNDDLRKRYLEHWLERLAEQVEEEEKTTKERHDVAEKELEAVLAQKKRVEEERDALTVAKKELTIEVAMLRREGEQKKEALRQIERELAEAIRREWSAAEENAAEFWAKKVVYSADIGTRHSVANEENGGKSGGKSPLFTSGSEFRPLETDKIGKFPTAKILEQNLKRRVVSGFNKELAAFLLATFERREPLILAGPCAERIVDALAATCGGRRAGTLCCDGDWNEDAVEQAKRSDDEIVLAKNALDARWVDRWPSALAESPKLWILTTPFAEDLTLLPSGFYNYFAPLLTEPLIDAVNWEGKPLTAGESVPIDRSNGMKTSGDDAFEFDDAPFVKSRTSGFYVERLRKATERACRIGRDALKFDPKNARRLTLLFALAPFAFATGNLDVLRETFEEEKDEFDAKTCETIRRLWGEGDE